MINSMNLKLTDTEKLKITDEALSHIKKVEADPDIEFEKVDSYDAWFAFNERIDFNVSEANFGNDEWMEEGEPMEWNCSAYAVELDDDEFAIVNTDHMVSLFSYKDGKVEFENE